MAGYGLRRRLRTQRPERGSSRCVVVEDSTAGVHAAMRAGMRVLAFAGAGHARSTAYRRRLEALKPALVFDDMLRLPDLIRDLESGLKVT